MITREVPPVNRCNYIRIFFVFVFTVSHLINPASVKSQSTTELDTILQGFEEPVPLPNQRISNATVDQNQSDPFSSVQLSGSFSQIIAYAPYGHSTVSGHLINDLTNIKSRIAVTAAIRFSKDWFAKINGWAFYDFVYQAKGYEQYPSEIVEENEKEIELGETFIRGRLSSLVDISFGRQIEVLGKSDFFRITDVINPSDNRERLLNDIEITRLPLLMTKADTYFTNWHVSALLTHEFRYGKDPVYGSDFYPFDFPAPPRRSMDNDLQNSTFSLSAERNYHGYDIEFTLASYVKEIDAVGLSNETQERYATRLTMVSAATEKAVGNWLYKMEMAAKTGLEFYDLQGTNSSSFDLLLGTDYTGFKNSRLSFEIHDRHLFYSGPEALDTDDTPARDELVWAIRYSRSFVRNTYTLVFLSYAGGFNFTQGSIQSLLLTYNYNDDLTISGGYILVNSGNNYFMENVEDNDRVYLKLLYKF